MFGVIPDFLSRECTTRGAVSDVLSRKRYLECSPPVPRGEALCGSFLIVSSKSLSLISAAFNLGKFPIDLSSIVMINKGRINSPLSPFQQLTLYEKQYSGVYTV